MVKIANVVQKLIMRWTAKSPALYSTITNISLGVGVTATILPYFLLGTPAWVVTAGSLLVAVGSKLTVEK